MRDMRDSVALIKNEEMNIHGTGFLVASGYLLTCAHVLKGAKVVSVRFPVLDWDAKISAGVLKQYPGDFPRPEGIRFWDIAILKLENGPPAGAVPLFITDKSPVEGHGFTCYGFPENVPQGANASGVLSGRVGGGLVQLDAVFQTGYGPKAGFSGAPVWDTDLNMVTGMVAAFDEPEELKVAYMLPSTTLVEALGQENITATMPPAPIKASRDAVSVTEPRYRDGAIADTGRQFISEMKSRVHSKRTRTKGRIKVDLELDVWVKNIHPTKTVLVDVHAFNRKGKQVVTNTYPLEYNAKKPHVGGGEFWSAELELDKEDCGKEPILIEYRLYLEAAGQWYTDAILHQYLLRPLEPE